MFYQILFLLFVVGVSKAENSTCGISPSIERYKTFNPNRIFGGENSNEGDFPWYIWMYTDTSGCSGSIIHEKWILTAAHCVNASKDLTIYFGSVNWTIMKTHNTKALRYIVHPGYVTGKNDVALIELSKPLTFSAYVQPVCLDHNVDPYLDEILTQCGMGKGFKRRLSQGFSKIIYFNLQDAPIQHINPSVCQSDEIRKICVGGINHASLFGDSGGPLMAIRDNRWVQIGIASALGWEDFEHESLSIHITDYYMRVSYYCDWIKETTNNELIGTLEFSAYVQRICLDAKVDPFPNEISTQIGMGDTFKKRDGLNVTLDTQYVLQDAPVQYIDCGKERRICIGGVNHVALPEIVVVHKWQFEKKHGLKLVLHVLIIIGFEDEILRANFRNYYMKVSYYCDWIKETTNNEVQC